MQKQIIRHRRFSYETDKDFLNEVFSSDNLGFWM